MTKKSTKTRLESGQERQKVMPGAASSKTRQNAQGPGEDIGGGQTLQIKSCANIIEGPLRGEHRRPSFPGCPQRLL